MDERETLNQLEKNDKFSIASACMGLLSLVTCCTVFLPIPLGALSILFAVLGKKKGQKMNLLGWVGIWLSAIGILYGVFSLIHIIREIPTLLNDPAYISTLDSYYEQLTGQTFFEYWESYGN